MCVALQWQYLTKSIFIMRLLLFSFNNANQCWPINMTIPSECIYIVKFDGRTPNMYKWFASLHFMYMLIHTLKNEKEKRSEKCNKILISENVKVIVAQFKWFQVHKINFLCIDSFHMCSICKIAFWILFNLQLTNLIAQFKLLHMMITK